MCTILNGCIIVELCSVKLETRSQLLWSSSLLSVLCWVEDSVISSSPPPSPPLFVWKRWYIGILKQYVKYYMDFLKKAYCCVFPPQIFFFLMHCSQESHCIPASIFVSLVCVGVLCKIRYTREVKNHSYASCELIWLRWCYLPCK